MGTIVAERARGLFIVVSSTSWDIVSIMGAYGTYNIAVAIVSERDNVAAVIDACSLDVVIVSTYPIAVVVASVCVLFVGLSNVSWDATGAHGTF